MPRRTDARERVLRTATELFRAQGYHGTGLNQVLADSGAPKGSLYFHFPGGKQQLATESLERSGTELCDLIEAALAAARSPAGAVRAVATTLAETLSSSDFRDGCPIATVALESGVAGEAVRQASERAYRSWLEVVADYLRRHDFGPQHAEALAVLIISSIEGALLLAKTQRDTAPLRTVADQLAALLETEPN